MTERIRIEFQGGEPLLRYDLIQKAMDYAMQRAEEEGIEASFSIEHAAGGGNSLLLLLH